MPVNVEPLQKILELEQKKGYNDGAVFGGLDKFLQKWSSETVGGLSDTAVLRRFRNLFVKINYAALSAAGRQQWVDKVKEFLPELIRTDIPSQAEAKSKPTKPATAKTGKPKGITHINDPVTVIKGINTRLADKFGKLGVRTVRDLLYFFPHRHIDYSSRKSISQLSEGEEQTVIANVWEARLEFLGGRRSTVADVGDETGNMRVVWFNNPYMVKQLATNSRISVSGKVSNFRGRPVFENPDWEPVTEDELVHTGRLVPVYSLTEGLYSRQVRKIMKTAVDQWSPQLEEFLPIDIRTRCRLLALPSAISQAHFPESIELKDQARIRLAFDELFLLQLGVLSKKRDWQSNQPGNAFKIDRVMLDKFTRALPFSLTEAQQKVVREILADLKRPQAMSRLLQGDVGSGKTVVAAIALLTALANGYQGALMAPTEILAEQHFNTLTQLLGQMGEVWEDGEYLKKYTGLFDRPLTLALFTGSVAQSKRQKLNERLQSGEIDIAIGTHALIQKDVVFHKLGLVVIDEQHRFGVEQRSTLRQKGYNPHILVMTATPIPRTLALTLYGDLDLSVIDQLPPGRQATKTKWLNPEQRESAYRFIAKQAAEGRQAFIICPLIEESDAVQAKAATVEFEKLQQVFPDLKLGLLHGKLANKDKDDVMHRFRAGEYNILVATPVIEVGIDVPNATVMLVESADRFGLSQLHQFRGRVGRGQAQSYCMLLADDPSEVGKQRLDVIERVQNGFVLAEEDLKLRGPGEFFGTRQSGLPDLRMAMLSDTGILELARKEAIILFEKDAKLRQPEHALLAAELGRVWPQAGEWS